MILSLFETQFVNYNSPHHICTNISLKGTKFLQTRLVDMNSGRSGGGGSGGTLQKPSHLHTKTSHLYRVTCDVCQHTCENPFLSLLLKKTWRNQVSLRQTSHHSHHKKPCGRLTQAHLVLTTHIDFYCKFVVLYQHGEWGLDCWQSSADLIALLLDAIFLHSFITPAL